MHGRGNRVGGGGQDRAGFDNVAARVAPLIPNPGEREQFATTHLKEVGLLGSSDRSTRQAVPYDARVGIDHT